jgi:hypothetical protein
MTGDFFLFRRGGDKSKFTRNAPRSDIQVICCHTLTHMNNFPAESINSLYFNWD